MKGYFTWSTLKYPDCFNNYDYSSIIYLLHISGFTKTSTFFFLQDSFAILTGTSADSARVRTTNLIGAGTLVVHHRQIPDQTKIIQAGQVSWRQDNGHLFLSLWGGMNERAAQISEAVCWGGAGEWWWNVSYAGHISKLIVEWGKNQFLFYFYL